MKTTIIDILNKIANGEEPPKKIYYKDGIFEYDEKEKDYKCSNDCVWLFDYYEITDILNDEVEILETTITYKPDKIEKIPIKDMKIQATSTNNYCYSISQPMKIIINKINEIIDHLQE